MSAGGLIVPTRLWTASNEVRSGRDRCSESDTGRLAIKVAGPGSLLPHVQDVLSSAQRLSYCAAALAVLSGADMRLLGGQGVILVGWLYELHGFRCCLVLTCACCAVKAYLVGWLCVSLGFQQSARQVAQVLAEVLVSSWRPRFLL